MPLLFMGGFGFGELLFVGFFVLVPTLLWVWALVDILRSRFKGDLDKIIWLLLVIFVPVIGWILYFAIGRSQRVGRAS